MCNRGQFEKIALFGGTFDPVHEGHLEIAAQAVKVLRLHKVIFLPCRQSPHKEKAAGATEQQRLQMLRLCLAGIPWAEVSDWEYSQPIPSYSWRTAEAFHEMNPQAKLFWLMGWDQWAVLPSWNRYSYFRQLVDFIVHERNGEGEALIDEKATFIAGRHPASSSRIREMFSRQREIPENWLNSEVTSYIQSEGVY